MVLDFARTHLAGLRRHTGESYFEHGQQIVKALREITADTTLLAAAMAHDLLVLPDGKAIMEASPLTSEERSLAHGMHKLRKLHIDENTKDLDRVIRSFANDSRLLLLRMAHRLIDIRHIRTLSPKRQREIARETLHMYTAIAGRLGFHRWRHEMEDICFQILQPKNAAALEEEFARMSAVDMICIDRTTAFLRKQLASVGISADLSHRIKGLYSTYRKIVVKGRPFRELTDRLALRIIVPSLDDCYRTLGVVHRCMHPVPGKLKDYIGAPKENGYRSIHTVVYPLRGVTEQPMEIQIRTGDMHAECELGIARHTDYKHYLNTLHRSSVRVNLFKNLLTLQAETRSPRQFANALRHYFDDGHIAIFDAKNNLYHMKKPVTALEFIERMQNGAKKRAPASFRVNGRIVPGTIVLQDGDTVEAVSRRR